MNKIFQLTLAISSLVVTPLTLFAANELPHGADPQLKACFDSGAADIATACKSEIDAAVSAAPAAQQVMVKAFLLDLAAKKSK